MREGWQRKTIGEVCDVINGGTPKTSIAAYWGGEHLWITPAEMGKRSSPYASDTERRLMDLGLAESSARLLPPFSVILSSRAPIGHLVINTEPMATNQGCKGLVPGKLIDHKFLFYYLGSIVDLLNDLGSGATFKEISGGKLKEIPLPIPSLPEQKRIVAILDEAFEGIAAAVVNAEKNLANARELFESYLNSVVTEVWESCELVSLSELATDITDGDHLPPPKAVTGVPFITIGNINKETRTIDFTDTFMVPHEYFNGLKANRKPKKGDVLYTVTGSFGIPVIVEDEFKFCFQRHIGLIRPKVETQSAWIYYLLLSSQVFKQANEGATGTAQKTVSLKALRGFKVPRVPPPQQRSAVTGLDALATETERLASLYRQKLAALAELKQSILQKAFSGELTSAPEKALQEAVA